MDLGSDYICPKCGRFHFSNARFPICDVCEFEDVIIVTSDVTAKAVEIIDRLSEEQYNDYLNSDVVGKERPKFRVFREYLRREYVFNSPVFSKAAYNKMIEAERLYWGNKEAEQAKPHCPNCGSTDFDMVPRKWSLLTGVLTNKVDRVCRRCKKRF